MGVCYSEEDDWIEEKYKRKRKNKKKNRINSIIYEEKTIYEKSFASKVDGSFREDLHNALSSIES